MARFSRMTVLNAILETGLVPVFYHPELEVVLKVAEACSRGGARLFEFTNRGDFAPQVFAGAAKALSGSHPDLILGAGSIVDAPTAALYIASGVNFVVGPNLNPEVARLCNRRKIAYSPGCGTASEVAAAEELGVEIVKIFPGGTVGGPAFVQSILGPCPWTRFMPTGGVDPTAESINAWFKAGTAAVGIGSKLITKELVAAGNFDEIANRVALTLALIRQARTAG
jgi:2-dehydro-3-deoxyphosphogluconate aldolase/(4S)-4-hydroxy-2-oxoglutarate aldolase